MRALALILIVLVSGCSAVNHGAQPDAAVARPDGATNTPKLSSLSPTKGIVTTTVTITGTNFTATPGSVTFGGAPATVTMWSDTSIVFSVPDTLPGSADVAVAAGASNSGTLPFRVTLLPAIYVENNVKDATIMFDTVSALAFDAATGAATQIGTPVSKGLQPSSYGGCSSAVWLHEHTRHLFTTGSTGVAVYNIDPITGALTAAPGSPFASGGTLSYAVVTNAAGTRAFVANYGSSNVSVYDVAANGVLTAVAGSPFAAGLKTDTLALSKDETKLLVNQYGMMFGVLSVDLGTGALSIVTGTYAGGTAIQRRPQADLFYITSSSGVNVWSDDEATGAATAIAGSPFANPPPAGILDTPAFTADGNRMYIGPDNSGYLMGFSLATDGTPAALGGSPWNFTTSLTDISCVAVSSDSGYLIAVGEAQQKIGVFALDGAGVPTQVTNSPFSYLPATASSGGLAITF